MKLKIFGFALLLGLATTLGACEDGGDAPTPTETTPAAGEPADSGDTKTDGKPAPKKTP